jgi:iron(III) transport system permease protein
MSPDRIRSSAWQYFLAGLVLAVLAAFLLYPIALTLRGGFADDPATGTGFTLRHLRAAFSNPIVMQSLGNSLIIAAGTTTLATLIALPLALLSTHYRFPLKPIFSAAILVPLILPPFVGAIGVRAMLGRAGALNALLGTEFDLLGNAKLMGVIAMQALSLYPIMYLNAAASLANLDPAMREAAQNLGAGPVRTFFRVTLPLIRPGLFAGGTIVFIWSFTELGTPMMFDYYATAPYRIFSGLKDIENNSEPYALTTIVLLISIAIYMIGRGIFGRQGYAMNTKAGRAATEVPLSGWKAWGVTAIFLAITLCAVVPHLGVVLSSVTVPGQWYHSVLPTHWTASHYQEALGAPDSFRAITNSLKLSVAAVALDLVIGITVAYLIVRTKVPGRKVMDALCMLPLAVPGLVMAFGYVAMSLRFPFGKEGPLTPLASIVATDPNPVPFLILAYAIRRLPYIVRSTVAGLEQTSGELEEAAINLGASRFTAVRRIIIPLIAANLIAGSLLVFAFSMLEVSDSLILAQQSADFPITKAIWSFADRLGDGPYIASAMGVWGMILLTVTLVAASVLLGRKLGAIFRV